MDKNRALFLDRDGTLIRDCNYLSDPDKVEVISGVGESLKKASHAGFPSFSPHQSIRYREGIL